MRNVIGCNQPAIFFFGSESVAAHPLANRFFSYDRNVTTGKIRDQQLITASEADAVTTSCQHVNAVLSPDLAFPISEFFSQQQSFITF